jgi:hypothetical protein
MNDFDRIVEKVNTIITVKYYKIYPSTVLKEIGCFPQSYKIEISPGCTVDDPLYLGHFIGKWATERVIIPQPVLEKKAKLTHFIISMAISGGGNLIHSAEANYFLQAAHSFGIQFLPITILSQKYGNQTYSIAHAYRYAYHLIDVERSVFEYLDIMDKSFSLPPVIITSNEALEEAYIQDNIDIRNGAKRSLYITHIVLKPNSTVDLFALNRVRNRGIEIFMSERLREAIEKLGNTGLRFTELNERF